MASLDDWLAPHLTGMRRIEDAARLDLAACLGQSLGWELAQEVDRAAPGHFQTSLGDRVAIGYGGAAPTLMVQVQELFGVTRHPTVGDPPVPLVTPARRPVQTTSDLPSFWASSYAEVRKEMRARYQKYPWPEGPASADATKRAKRRG